MLIFFKPFRPVLDTLLNDLLRDGSKSIEYPGRDQRQGGDDFFSKKKIGGRRLFFEKKKGGKDFFYNKIWKSKNSFFKKNIFEDQK